MGWGNPLIQLVEVLRRSAQPPLLAHKINLQAIYLDSLVVEVPGIEPGSSGTKTGLLRA